MISVAVASLLMVACAGEGRAGVPLVFDRVDGVYSIPLEGADREVEAGVEAEATVMYSHPAWQMLYVLGRERGGYVEVSTTSPPLVPGDVISLTGVCFLERNRWGETASFQVRLRRRGDLEILGRPPRWTSDRLTGLLVGVCPPVAALKKV